MSKIQIMAQVCFSYLKAKSLIFIALLILIVLELFFIFIAIRLENKNRKKKYLDLLLTVLLIFLLWCLSEYGSSVFNALYISDKATILLGIFTFCISNVIFDIPSWREGYEKYTLNNNGKKIKFMSQFSIISYTTGISLWQKNLTILNLFFENSNFLKLIFCIFVFGAFPIAIIMGIVDVIVDHTNISKKLFKEDKKTYIVHIHGKKKIHKH
ncbi:hypothetical protein [Limosilactobacillus reuteri]|uniref:hypothetical protein n=1 Tax=Limosilactobacillus reuteri TaxID=1598 RepID=UPI001E50AD06|nr:hypothetical protein [Limosilactobacillus reuteri]MCC4359123.1 hypothetical protein [Limosilactobacillus reuteri]MCC4361737.1 hypothetical protein [Limosilactobacillus reuteri]MCC4365426.1 hypothetical protein [Limosilactobacillus reuteri]